MHRAPSGPRLLAWSIALAGAIVIATSMLAAEAQQVAYIRQDNPVARQSMLLAHAARNDAAVTTPTLYSAEGRVAWNTVTHCPMVHRGDGGWQDHCPVADAAAQSCDGGCGDNLWTYVPRAGDASAYLHPTAGPDAAVVVGAVTNVPQARFHVEDSIGTGDTQRDIPGSNLTEWVSTGPEPYLVTGTGVTNGGFETAGATAATAQGWTFSGTPGADDTGEVVGGFANCLGAWCISTGRQSIHPAVGSWSLYLGSMDGDYGTRSKLAVRAPLYSEVYQDVNFSAATAVNWYHCGGSGDGTWRLDVYVGASRIYTSTAAAGGPLGCASVAQAVSGLRGVQRLRFRWTMVADNFQLPTGYNRYPCGCYKLSGFVEGVYPGCVDGSTLDVRVQTASACLENCSPTSLDDGCVAWPTRTSGLGAPQTRCSFGSGTHCARVAYLLLDSVSVTYSGAAESAAAVEQRALRGIATTTDPSPAPTDGGANYVGTIVGTVGECDHGSSGDVLTGGRCVGTRGIGRVTATGGNAADVVGVLGTLDLLPAPLSYDPDNHGVVTWAKAVQAEVANVVRGVTNLALFYGAAPDASAATNLFGLYLESLASLATNVWGIFSGSPIAIGSVTNGLRLGQMLGMATSANYGGISMTTWSTTTGHASAVDMSRSKSATIGTYTSVASGDALGYYIFRGADGSQFVDSAWIAAYVDGTPGASDMPGRLAFATTPDGAAAGVERMRISSAGLVGIGTGSGTPAALLHVAGAAQLGTVSTTTGSLAFAHASSALLTTFQAGNTTGAATYTWPLAPPTINGQALTSTTGGVMSWGGTSATGPLTYKRTATATSYSVAPPDVYIGVISTAAARTITLEAAATAGAGRVLVIKDESGGASVRPITIDAAGAETIDGALTFSVDVNYGAINLLCTGTAWHVF